MLTVGDDHYRCGSPRGQAGDNPQLLPLINDIRVPLRPAAAHSATPNCVIAEKAYSHPATRKDVRRTGIRVIPEKSDQIAHRTCKGS